MLAKQMMDVTMLKEMLGMNGGLALYCTGQAHGERLRKSPNGRLRNECLNEHQLTALRHARHLMPVMRDDQNHQRPHTNLDGLSPRDYHKRSKEDQTLNRTGLTY